MTPTTRTSGPGLTADRLGEAWPEVSARLRRLLASRGVDPSLSDDIVQEVALRVLDKQVPFTDPADLYRWAATTARNLHIDHVRTDGRTTCDDELVSIPDQTDVAHAAERRVALGHVLRAMAGLRPGERAAILDSLDDRGPRTSQALVRRHRARATLRKACGGVLSGLALARLRLRAAAPAMRTASAATMLAPALVIGAGTFTARPPADVPERVLTVAPPARRVVSTQARSATRAPATAAVRTGTARAAGAARVAPRAQAVAPPAAASKPGTTVGPMTWEPAERKKPGPTACLENEQKPVWCTPGVYELAGDTEQPDAPGRPGGPGGPGGL